MHGDLSLLSEPDCGIVTGGTSDLFPKRDLDGVVAGGVCNNERANKKVIPIPVYDNLTQGRIVVENSNNKSVRLLTTKEKLLATMEERGANAVILDGGVTLLMYAAGTIDVSLMKTLFKNGASVDKADKNGCRAIHYYFDCMDKSEECLCMLLAAGTDLKKPDKNGNTVWQYAKMRGRLAELEKSVENRRALVRHKSSKQAVQQISQETLVNQR